MATETMLTLKRIRDLISRSFPLLLAAVVAFHGTGHAGEAGKGAASSAKGKASAQGLFTIEAVPDGGELVVGKNKLGLVVRDQRGKNVEGAEVVVTPWMPAGGHGVWEKPVVTERGAGIYRADNIVIVRSGHWDLRVAVKKGALSDQAVFSFPVGLGGPAPAGASGKPRGNYQRTVEYYKIPNVTLLNQDGKKVNFHSYLDSGKPVIVDFIFTTCTTICPILSAGFAGLRDELGEKGSRSVQFISLSIDPDRDRPDRMKAYLARFNGNEGWDFLTGSREDITQVLRAFNAYFPDKMEHEPLYLLRGPKSDHWVRVKGLISGADFLREFRGVEKQ